MEPRVALEHLRRRGIAAGFGAAKMQLGARHTVFVARLGHQCLFRWALAAQCVASCRDRAEVALASAPGLRGFA